jgi:pimeloyl-ACP methyl ester carboxylesterase
MAVRLGCQVVVVPEAVHSPAAENPLVTAKALVEFCLG